MFICGEFTRTHPTNLEHNMVFGVVDRLCDKIKGKGHSMCTWTGGSPVQRFSTVYGLVRQRHSAVEWKRNA